MEPFESERGEQDSLAPVQLESDDQEVASMKRGKGTQLLALGLIALGSVSGAVFTIRHLDREHRYEQVGAAVQQLQRTHIDAFEECALPFGQASNFVSSGRLYAAFADMIERSATRYAGVLQVCEPKLASLRFDLAALRPPADVQVEWRRLQEATVQLQDAVAALRTALQDPIERDNYVAVTAHADHLAKALFAYDDRGADFHRALDKR